MQSLNKTLNKNSKLAKVLSSVLKTQKLDETAAARLSKHISSMKANAAQIEEILEHLCSEYSTETNNNKLRLWERKLLDLSLRNNLLNLKLGKSTLPLASNDICQMEDELNMGREIVLEQKELKALYRTVRTNFEETGANTLFIALGILHWCERPGARVYSAPILLMPVSIVPMKKDAYAIRKRDEEVMLNITLMEFLHQQFGIEVEELDPLPQDAYGIDVGLVLHLIREAINGKEGWKITEESILGVFSFAKFVLWNDIHTNSAEVMSNNVVRSLVEGRLLLEAKAELSDARKMDIEVRPEEMAIPLDADSSQLEAVADSLNEQSFLLYGPPGTGKSQTITNLIANALYHNKRVLFVAQKKAALDVVYSRLQKIGLAPFCVELHSNKVEKHHFLEQLQQAINVSESGNKDEFERTANALYAQRLQLMSYANALHAKHENGYSLYECIDKYLSIDKEPLTLPADFLKGKTNENIEALYERITLLDSGETILGISPSEHPLRGFTPKSTPQSTIYTSKYSMGDTIEKMLPELPQIVDNIRKQIERGRSMSFINKTHRQYIETDYKWRKFVALATIDDSLTDDVDTLYETVVHWKDNADKLPQWQHYTDVLNQLEQSGLHDAVEQYLNGTAVCDIQKAFMSAVYSCIAKDIISQNQILADFNSLQFEQHIEKYCTLKQDFQNLVRQELVARLAARIPIGTGDAELSAQLTMLRKRIGNKGRGTGIRNIIAQMPDLLPMLCPVMLMSPLSVAQYIEMDGEKFDLVIFDEASQMPTSEAVGAIARAKNCIIVGDPKQMPPTNFFKTSVTDDEEVDLDDQESILDDCISLSMPARYLGWHYRSKHESLITFSNRHYYDNHLLTFPSVDEQKQHVTWQHVEGYYDYGNTRTNQAEAEAIVTEIITRLKHNPERSIGVVAFSRQQSELIEDLLSTAIADEPVLERLNKESKEPLFVKNLENVQGDERDTILFSIGYGPDKEGRVSMNFGPLNRAGGERRLNVAISRARYEMKIFSTLLPEHIDERRTQARGVLDLKSFLKFAQHNIEENIKDVDAGKNQTAHMVEGIAKRLREYGYNVNIGIGSSEFKVDLGVTDSVNPPKYKLGIICDGKAYQNLKTVRDREVVQPAMLKMLGWRLMRVWSIDWFTHPDAVIKNILKKL